MNYELVKKLKKAKFPFDFKESILGDDTYTYPALEIIIHECGDKFAGLIKGNSQIDYKWTAQGLPIDKIGNIGHGETTIEAVAKLWLKLNTK